APLRVMRAVAHVVDASASSAQFLVHPAVQIAYRGLVVDAARHAGLVGHDKDVVTAVVKPADCVHGAGKPAKICAAIHIAGVVVERTVAIEKYGGPARWPSPACPGGERGHRLTVPPHCWARLRD